jgi:hypothetical protein
MVFLVHTGRVRLVPKGLRPLQLLHDLELGREEGGKGGKKGEYSRPGKKGGRGGGVLRR